MLLGNTEELGHLIGTYQQYLENLSHFKILFFKI